MGHSYVADGSHHLDAREGKISVDSAGDCCECGGSGIRYGTGPGHSSRALGHVSLSHPDDVTATRRCVPPVKFTDIAANAQLSPTTLVFFSRL